MDESFRCPVCLEPYSVDVLVPRLLPCSHTVCERCLGEFMKKRSVMCPVCRNKHSKKKGLSSFPENRYVLDVLKSDSHKSQFALCEEHEAQLNMFCEDCKKEICRMCLLKQHRAHNVYDILEEQEAKVESLIEHLQDCREHWTKEADKVKEKYTGRKRKLENLKSQYVKVFDGLIDNTSSQMSRFTALMDKKVKTIDKSIATLGEVSLLESPKDMLKGYQAAQKISTRLLLKEVPYEYYEMVYEEELQPEDICEPLEEVVSGPVHNNRQFESTFMQLWTKLQFEGEVCRLQVLSNRTFVVGLGGGVDSSRYIHWITQYDTKGVILQSKRCKQCVYDMTQVEFYGTTCLALTLCDEKRIDFFDINNLKTPLDSYDTRNRSPTVMTTSSCDDETLVFADALLQMATVVHCATFNVEEVFFDPTFTAVHGAEDIVCLGKENKQLLIILAYSTTHGQITAHNIQSRKLVWSISDKVPGLESRMCALGMVSDEQAHIYVQDGEEAVHKFSVQGNYVSTVLKQGEKGVGSIHHIAWDKENSHLIVIHKCKTNFHVSAAKV